MAALALTAALVVVTARPAAAAEAPSLWGHVWSWMSNLVWSQVLSDGSSTSTSGTGDGVSRAAGGLEEGYEIDPNGYNARSLSDTPAPRGPQTGTTIGGTQIQ